MLTNSNRIASRKTKNLAEEKAIEMANYFDERITTNDLAYWLPLANSYSSAFPNPMKIEGKESDETAFINSIGMFLLPELIACKNKKERIEILKNELVSIFETNGYLASKQALSGIGISFMKSFVKYTDSGKDVINFMPVYSHFLHLTGMYKEYCFIKDSEAKKIAA